MISERSDIWSLYTVSMLRAYPYAYPLGSRPV